MKFGKLSNLKKIRKENRKKNKKICLVSASGGHFEQLCRVKKMLEKYDCFVVTERTGIQNNTDYLVTQVGLGADNFIKKTIRLFWEVGIILKKEKPDFVITTGTYISFPFMIYCKIWRKKFVYIETFARISDRTKAGAFMYKFADLFIYQWKELEKFYPKGIYGGSIY